jgi:MFS family permease
MQRIVRLRASARALGTGITSLLVLLLAAGAVGGPARNLLPVYLEHDLAWPPLAIAALTGTRLLTAALSAPVGGALADTFGPRRVLWLGLTGLPIAALAFLTPAAPLLAVLILVAGLADGLQSTGSQAYLVARASRASIGLATSAFYIGSTLGGALGGLGASIVLGGWDFAGLGAASLVAGLVLLGGVAALPAGTTQPNPGQASLASSLRNYRALAAQPPVRSLATMRFLSTCFWGAATLLWPLLIARLSGDPAVAALFGAVSMVLAAAGQLAIGRLVDRIGPDTPALVLTGLIPLVAVLSALAVDSLPALFVGGVLGTAAAWALSGTLPPLIRALAPAHQRGQVVGLLHVLWCLAMLSGTLAGGWLVTLNTALPFWAAAVLTLPTALAALGVRRILRGKGE